MSSREVSSRERKSWDVEAYERKAQDRRRREAEKTSGKADEDEPAVPAGEVSKEEFMHAPKDAQGPEGSERAFLKARQKSLDLEAKVGTSEMVSAEQAAIRHTNAVVKSGVGWHCKVCNCFMKDSNAYLDHINGRQHLKKLGFSMRVERSTNDQVKDRLKKLAAAKKAKEQSDKIIDEVTDFNELVKKKDEENKRLREERKQQRKERKKRERELLKEQQQEEESEGVEGIDPDMAAIIGFSGFGGST